VLVISVRSKAIFASKVRLALCLETKDQYPCAFGA
jgi:hypothetical protein